MCIRDSPPRRMLALPNAAFTSAGVCQSACLTCSCQDSRGCSASGWDFQNTLRVERAISRMWNISPKLGPGQDPSPRFSYGPYRGSPAVSRFSSSVKVSIHLVEKVPATKSGWSMMRRCRGTVVLMPSITKVQGRDAAWAGRELEGILGVDAALAGVALLDYVLLGEAESLAYVRPQQNFGVDASPRPLMFGRVRRNHRGRAARSRSP